MSATVVKEFLVSLGLDVQGGDNFDKTIGKATLAVAGLGAAVFSIATGVFAFTHKIAEEFDAIGDLANRVNSTAGELEELGYVAQLTGSSVDAATGSVERLSKVAGDAAMGLGKGKKVFEEIGVSVTDANGKLKNSSDLLWEVGDAIKGMERGRQIAVLQRLGIDKTMVDALTTSVGGLRDEFKTVYAAVGLDSDKAAEKAGRFMDSMDRFNFVLGAIGKSLAVNFMDKFTDAFDNLRRLIVDNLPRIMATIKPVIALVLSLADVFIALAYRAGQAVGTVIGWVMDIVDALNGWVVAIGAVALAWKYLNLGFLATPVGAVLALVAAVGLLIDDYMTWKEGGDSLVDWSQWQNEIQLAIDILNVFRTALENAFTYIFATVDAIIKLFQGDFSGAFAAMEIAIESLGNILSTIFGPILDVIKSEFQGTFDAIGAIIDKVIGKITGAIDWMKSAGGAAADFFGIGGDNDRPTAPITPMAMTGPALQPAASYMGNPSQNVNQETNILLQGSNNPEANARAIEAQQRGVNGDLVRNLKGAAR